MAWKKWIIGEYLFKTWETETEDGIKEKTTISITVGLLPALGLIAGVYALYAVFK